MHKGGKTGTMDDALYALGHLRSFDMTVVKEACCDWAEFRATVRVVFDWPAKLNKKAARGRQVVGIY